MKGHIHILGICGTFMGGIALLAKELGYRVSGSDANVYPPMSTQLEAAGIELMEGYLPEHLQPAPDQVVVGNAMARGNPAVEYLLNQGLDYISGPQWLAENLLHGKWVLAVAGTHGKTTTSSILAWVLEYAGMSPGFLIGGVPANFGLSARSGDTDFFVVEADEYDTAFFDKRSKFVHYRPRTLVINNLEFDHADIFPDLAAIQRQFHHLVRTVPGDGRVIHPAAVPSVEQVLAQGCWTPTVDFALAADSQWRAELLRDDGSAFLLQRPGAAAVSIEWAHLGRHNIENALAAMAAAQHVGVTPEIAAEALAEFRGVKRRLEVLGSPRGVTVYDDFAHHPTAIATTLEGLRAHVGKGRVIALIEPRSNTMRMGQHREQLAAATAAADQVYWFQPPGMDWSLSSVVQASPVPAQLADDVDALARSVANAAQTGDRIVIMSNGSFGGIHQRLLRQLDKEES
ncbi:UDP-N-acetylmuramate:L-alanyl-gamma-D-glutamyl-meso-diaminopimelate ligase [Parahaliea sp. F7430]|uniref:UDP-N-acetylmuramate--L-alanyl-gamma-D-glutamyl-meso-2,6-diaminoheptandioate ligase n=1 Tax=Sediminihaliea albiluteola TaxID=2758564 RepID=A0A7W2TW71_9GAMM|nr:UDP-N-acetylmuramate:L-alanyl-gamma-D-glutamyl-meso-diaminopimelate ligase [Sediminihaliea albiluteola]MBA6413082.1 UDP-N-acetylmuramate:L-alanyl-gamma-D-glutamyl-meso-diaminopimelate ligase [Sediminihaliea albiluteola]